MSAPRPAVRIGRTLLFHGGQARELSWFEWFLYRTKLRRTAKVPPWHPWGWGR